MSAIGSSIDDSAALGTRNSPGGPFDSASCRSPSREAFARIGTGLVCATAAGIAPRLIHCSTPTRTQNAADRVRELLPSEVRLGTVQDQQVAAVDRAVIDLERRPLQPMERAVDDVERRPTDR